MLTVAIIEDGVILDSQEISREEYENLSLMGAFAILSEMQIG
jgi:hypothetical protein